MVLLFRERLSGGHRSPQGRGPVRHGSRLRPAPCGLSHARTSSADSVGLVNLVRSWTQDLSFAGRRAVVEGVNAPSAKDQDRYGVATDGVVVTDGVTPLDPGGGPAVQRFAEDVVATLLAGGERELPALLREAVARNPGGPPGAAPACTLGLARAITTAEGTHIELASLADTAVYVRLRDGSLVVCLDERVGGAEARTTEIFYRALLDGASAAEARRTVATGSGERRARRNTAGSYWVLADEPAAAQEAQVIRMDPADVETILVCSDGFTRAWDLLGVLAGPEDALEAGRSLSEVASEIRTAELWRSRSPWPLFGGPDDITALRLQF